MFKQLVTITIYYPDGFVLEVLEAFLGRAATGPTGRTLLAFLRVNSVCGFGIKEHLFEWLVAFDISCARSEINRLMGPDASRSDCCIAATVKSEPQVYNKIIEKGAPLNIWVVRDTHNSHQDRWVDVAYPIEVADQYEAGFVLMECKTGYKKRHQQKDLEVFCDRFFKKAANFAQMHPSFFFVVTFVSECDSLRESANLIKYQPT